METKISYYAVTVFGVDHEYKEYCRVVWKGIATNSDSAVNRAVNLCYEEKHRAFMRPYLKASICSEVELNDTEKQLVSDAKEYGLSLVKAVTKNHDQRINEKAIDYMSIAISPGVERYWRSVIKSESSVNTSEKITDNNGITKN